MRKALIVGIDHYEHADPLHGCVSDAHSVRAILEIHSDGSPNFDVKLLTGTGPTDLVSRAELRAAARELFDGDTEVALFYFAGHGHIESTGGYLLASDGRSGDEGLPLHDLLAFASEPRASNRVIILDSCHSGVAGSSPTAPGYAQINEGLTILSASTAEQYATEENGSGVFTALLVDALAGGAANLVGDVTPGSVYAYIDQSLGPWDQRPVFKTNVKRFVSLRKAQPPLDPADLRRITELFPHRGFEFPLDPSYEPDSANPDPENTRTFAVLQQYNRVNLVVPVGAPHMYFAAMDSKACKLTVLGEHYRRLVEKKRI
jgi:hypothetical protein